MNTEYALFDASSYLDSEEMIAEYLTAAAEDENPDVMLLAIANVAKARGMTHVAKAAGLSRESLYKTLAPGAHPRFRTVQAILRALNVRLGLHVSTGRFAKAHRKTTAEERSGQQSKLAAKKSTAGKLKVKRAAPAKKRA
jgi:probable addiction module antidote protein